MFVNNGKVRLKFNPNLKISTAVQWELEELDFIWYLEKSEIQLSFYSLSDSQTETGKRIDKKWNSLRSMKLTFVLLY